MAEVNVENISDLMDQFEETMGFPADSPGLALTEEQLVNFMLLCHEAMHGGGYESEEDEYEDEYEEEEIPESGMKVKVIKMHGGDVSSMIDDMLGHGGPKVDY